MPVTKTAKRALRSSKRKKVVNDLTLRQLEIALRKARATKSKNSIKKAISLADKAARKKVIHKNKAARIKSSLTHK
jgi:small subunit ribosomal protein S20